MSYDILFIRKPADETWDSALEAHSEEVAESRTVDAQLRAQWDRVARKLIELDATLERAEDDQSLELSDSELGLQISFFPSEIALTIAYWHEEGEEADDVMDLAREMARVIERETGYTGWDGQQECPFLESPQPAASQTMQDITRRIREVPAARKRPWWKFWS